MKQEIIIILVSPQMGENIGAVARAMRNFSISQMRIVKPRDGWPNEAAKANATFASDIIESAQIFDNLNEAIADIEYLYASTSEKRSINKNYIDLKNIKNSWPSVKKIGIMFGRESCGLTNEEITQANSIINISTWNSSSLNLAQAAVLICYEVHNLSNLKTNLQEVATREEINYFLEHLLTILDKRNFFKIPNKRKIMIQNISNIFTRIDKLSKPEIKTLRGILSTLDKEV